MTHVLRLLGRAGATEAFAVPQDRRGCLLAYLAVEGGWVGRDRLALLFWPDSDEPTAKRNLRQLVLRTKRLPLEPGLETSQDAVRWRVRTDVELFRAAVARGDLRTAVDDYGGPLLAGLSAHDVGGFDAWLEAERSRLRDAFTEAAGRLSDDLVASGRYEDAAELLERLYREEPFAEDLVVRLARALYLAGRREQAIDRLQRFRRDLREELDMEPLPSTVELDEAIRHGRPVASPEPSKRREHVHRVAPTRLAGRDDVRSAVLAADTPVVLLSGEPGIGKSALLAELTPGAPMAIGVEGLSGLPYYPMIRAVRGAPHLADLIGPYKDDLGRLAPDLGSVSEPAPLPPGEVRLRLAEAFTRFVEAGGGLLAFDDLQWADEASLEVLLFLASRGVSVMGAFRSAEVGPGLGAAIAALSGSASATVVPVDVIDERATRAVIGDLMGRADGPPTFSRRIHQLTGGNPLFLLETVRALFESGRLRRDAEGWHTDVDDVTVDYSELTVPPAVAAVVARRLAAATPGAVAVTRAIALARTDVDLEVISAATGLPAADAARALDEAHAAGLVVAGTIGHDLLRQAVEAEVPAATRSLLHRRLAEGLVGRADAALVARHWLQGGDHARAVACWLVRAAELRAAGLQPAAVDLLAAAIEDVPDGDPRLRLRLALADAAREAGDLATSDGQLELVRRSERLTPPTRTRLSLSQAWTAVHRGHFNAAAGHLADVVAAAWSEEDEDTLYDIALLQATVARDGGRLEEAIATLEKSLEALRRGPPSTRLVRFTTSLAALLDEAGRGSEALERHREASDLAKAIGSRYYQVEAALNMAFCLADGGRHEEVVELAVPALELGDYDGTPILRNNLAASLFELGRLEEALEHYAVLANQRAAPHLRVLALARSASCLVRLGRATEAGERIVEALEEVGEVELPASIGTLACAVLEHGDSLHLTRLAEATADFDPVALPDYVRRRLKRHVEGSSGTPSPPGAWWLSVGD